jgi:isocitrate dehydrogenase
VSASGRHTVTVAHGDGIGPEIMEAVRAILDAAGAPLSYERVDIGREAYDAGHRTGVPPAAWDTIRANPAFLKAPITTPQGGGYASLNVTLRKALSLFANVRPTKAFAPYVASPHPGLDLVIVRENEEDLYAGIEHQHTAETAQALKLVTRPGCERIVRYAFEYARACGRRKVTCMTKDNIMKHTDGLFHAVFDEVAAQFDDVAADHHIVDIGAARLAAQPERFDVIVTLNLYGDILSDIAGQIAGSVGLAGSANVGDGLAMFEAVHGSAPDIAGRGIANPSGLLAAATQMLVHLGEAEVAQVVGNAWLATLESGVHTPDMYRQDLSHTEVGTDGFTEAVIQRLGQAPVQLRPVAYREGGIRVGAAPLPPARKELVGVDVFLDWSADGRAPEALGDGRAPEVLGRQVQQAAQAAGWELSIVTNRGVKVYPGGWPETLVSDHWRCRFLAQGAATFPGVLALLRALHEAGLEVVKTEHLYTFDGQRAYSLGQGE